MDLINKGLGKSIIYEGGKNESVLTATDDKIRHASLFIRQERQGDRNPWLIKFGHVKLWKEYDIVPVGIVHYDIETGTFTSVIYLPMGITPEQHEELAILRAFIEKTLKSGIISPEDLVTHIVSLL